MVIVYLAPLPLAAFVAALIVLIVGEYRLVTGLRRAHPDVWERLGKPSPWFTQFGHALRVQSFLMDREYASIPDEQLSRVCERLRGLTISVYALAATALLAATLATQTR
jgi:hypothetical protein